MIGYPETSVWNYQSTIRKIPEERKSRLHRDGKLQSRKVSLEVNTGETEYMVVFRKQNAEQNNSVKKENKTFDRVAKVKYTGAKPANQISCVKTPRRDEIEFREYLPQLGSEFCLCFLFKNPVMKLWNSILSVASCCYEALSFTFRNNMS